MLGFIGSSYVVNAAAALVSVFGGMIIYFFVMIQVRGITKDDLAMLPERIKQIIPRKVLEGVR